MGTNNAIYITELQTTYTLPEEVTLNSNHTKSYIDTLMVLNKLPFNGLDIYYADNIWDFSSAIKLNIHKSSLKFNFGLMNNSVFTNDMKNFILLTLLENKIKIQTIHNRYLTIKDFFLFAENNYHVYHVEDITVPIVKAFLQKIRDEDSVTKLHDVKSSLRAFYMQYSANFKDITSKGLLALFEQDDAKAYRAYQYSKRSKPIPKEYFNKMLSACITVSNDENQTLSNRGAACVYIILSQTGLRIGEVLGLRTNCLRTTTIFNGEKAHYFEYSTWKREKGNNVSSSAITYVNELTYNAYNTLIQIYAERRQTFGLDNLYMGGIHVTSQSFPLDSNDFARAALRLFVNFDNNGLLSTVNLSSDIYPTLHVFKNGNRKISQSGQFIYEKIQTVTFPDTQQLRFHCCTELAEKGVPLEYIQRFMSHLTSSMVRYHILPKSSPQEDMEFSLKTLQEVVSGKTKILGDNKGLSDNINEFINANHFNVATDLDEICKALANKIPIRQKTGGVCIKSSQLRECSMDAKTNEFYCAYGVCPNIVHFYYYADITYRQCKELQETININRTRGHMRQVEKETNMLYNIAKTRLLPELEDLKSVIERDGFESVYEMHPEVQPIVENMDTIEKEAITWSTKN